MGPLQSVTQVYVAETQLRQGEKSNLVHEAKSCESLGFTKLLASLNYRVLVVPASPKDAG